MYNKLERKFGKYAVQGLMKYIIVLYATGFLINVISPSFYSAWLMLDITKVFHGQVWRLFTFIIQPMDSNILLTALMLYVYYSIGTVLERVWGTFRFNLFYITGILFNILAVIIIYVVTYLLYGVPFSYPVSLEYLNLSLFLAFSTMFPEMTFYLMMLIPVKAKYLSIAYAAFLIYDIYAAFSVNLFYGFCVTVMIVVAMGNFLIYFFNARKHLLPHNLKRRMQFKKDMMNGQNIRHETINPEAGKNFKGITRHKCAVCGRTELDGDHLEFRFCSKCNGNYEYCQDHLFTHEHVK